METIIFGNYTVQDLLIAAGVIIGLSYLWSALKKAFKKKEVQSYAQGAQCSRCGWQGQVSMHAGKCPKCNNLMGDQQAKNFQ